MKKLAFLAMLLGATAFQVGCTESVEDKKQDLIEAHQEKADDMREAAREGDKDIAEEKADVKEEAREKAANVAEEAREGDKDIADKEKDLAESQRKEAEERAKNATPPAPAPVPATP